MSAFDELFRAISKQELPEQVQLLHYLNNALSRVSRKLTKEDRAAFEKFLDEEITALLRTIPKTDGYRQKDLMFESADLIFGMVMALYPNRNAAPQDLLTRIQLLSNLIDQERSLERELDEVFTARDIPDASLTHLLFLAGQSGDDYRRGRLWAGLIHYRKRLADLTEAGRNAIARRLLSEAEGYLSMEQLPEDGADSLELMADLAREFPGSGMEPVLTALLDREECSIRYFAAESLLLLGGQVPQKYIDLLAHDLVHADLTHRMLTKLSMLDRFPAACSSPEYLAKSDLVHWLTYPTELGKVPDEIEYLGPVKYLLKKEVYHVFRFRSDSETLDEESRGKWLIGWSDRGSGTFSSFAPYDDYRRPTLAATLKAIKKQLIG